MDRIAYKHLSSTIEDYDVLLFDIWGVVYDGEKPYQGVVETINNISKMTKVLFLSNSPNPSDITSNRISSWGINVTKNEVYTSGQISRQWLNDSQNKFKIHKPYVYHLGEDRNQYIMQDLNVLPTTDINTADILLLTLYRDEGENLDEFDYILKSAAQNKITTICANPDTTIPQSGKLRYCSGYFAQKLEQFGGKVLYAGKPHQVIYDSVLKDLPDVPKNRILMIGDTFDTDILGANNAGIHSALVMTGNAEKFHIHDSTLEDKLTSLTNAAEKCNMIPTFITKI